MYFLYDPTYILVIIAFLLTLFASFGVKGTFAKYDKVLSRRGISGAQAARYILDANGLRNVQIQHISGDLSDNFNPKTNIVSLSDSTYNSTSVAAIGVAAHECGHAIQYAESYAPIKIRNSIVPVVNFGNALSMPLFIIGLIIGYTPLAYAGAILFGLVLVFQLITLPVEFNASNRAVKILEGMNMLTDEELKGTKKVLRSAAMTYVAAVAATSLQLARLLLIVSGRRRN